MLLFPNAAAQDIEESAPTEPLKWQDVVDTDTYQRADPEKRKQIKTKFFEDFIATRDDLPTNIEGVRNVFMNGEDTTSFKRKATDLLKGGIKEAGRQADKMVADKLEQLNTAVETVTDFAVNPATSELFRQSIEMGNLATTQEMAQVPLMETIGGKALDYPLKVTKGAVEATAAAKSPLQGVLKPEEQRAFAASTVDALNNVYGIKDPEVQTVLGTIAGTAMDALLMHSVYNVAPKKVAHSYEVWRRPAIRDLRAALAGEFEAAGVEGLTQTIYVDPKGNAVQMTLPKTVAMADEVISRQFQQNTPFGNTPFALGNTVKWIKDNKGRLGGYFKELLERNKPQPIEMLKLPPGTQYLMITDGPNQGYYYEYPDGSYGQLVRGKLEKVSDKTIQIADNQGRCRVISKIENTTPGTLYVTPDGKIYPKMPRTSKKATPTQGGVIKVKFSPEEMAEINQAMARGAPKEQPPASASPSAVAQPPPSASLETLEPPANVSAGKPPATPARERLTKSERLRLLKQRAKKLKNDELAAEIDKKDEEVSSASDDIFNRGNREDLSSLDEERGELRSERNRRLFDLGDEDGTILYSGIPINLLVRQMDTLLQNLPGIARKTRTYMLYQALRLGNPFYIAENFPEFKPLYKACRDTGDMRNEIFNDLVDILRPSKQIALSPQDKELLSWIARIGNNPSIVMEGTVPDVARAAHLILTRSGGGRGRYFTSLELRELGVSEAGIEMYGRISSMYKKGLDLAILKHKLRHGYATMTPEERAAFDADATNKLNSVDGYFSQERPAGDWAVVRPEGPDGTKFFSLYATEPEAIAAARELGPTASHYLRVNFESYVKHLSVADLERLIDAANITDSGPEIQALFKELKKRGFQSHFVRRQNVPGFNWDWNNVTQAAQDYAEGISHTFAKTIGRGAAEDAYKSMVQATRNPLLKDWGREYITGYFDTPLKTHKTFLKTLYAFRLLGNIRLFYQDTLSPLFMTMPEMSTYYKNLGVAATERAFLGAYKDASAFITEMISGRQASIPADLRQTLLTLRKRGVLGDQVNRFLLGRENVNAERMNNVLTFFVKAGEAIKRVHAATVAYDIATKIGYNPEQKYEFIREFIDKVAIAYGKHNLPTKIITAGSLRSVARDVYALKHYNWNYLQHALRVTTSKDPEKIIRFYGSLLALGGISSWPLFKVGRFLYERAPFTSGENERSFDKDFRELLNKTGTPNKAVDMLLHGIPTAAGIDMTSLVGGGDVYDPVKGFIASTAAAGLGQSVVDALDYAEQGEWSKAWENASPAALSGYFKTTRLAREGLTQRNGDKITDVTDFELALTLASLTPSRFTKEYEKARAIKIAESRKNRATATLNRDVAKLEAEGKFKEAAILKAKAMKKGIRSSSSAIRDKVQRLRGRGPKYQSNVALEARRAEELYK